MTWADFRAMIENSPVDSRRIEWRRADGSLIAASPTDRSASGLSGESRRSLGSLVILRHIRRAAELRLPYVDLGYWQPEDGLQGALPAARAAHDDGPAAAAGNRLRPTAEPTGSLRA